MFHFFLTSLLPKARSSFRCGKYPNGHLMIDIRPTLLLLGVLVTSSCVTGGRSVHPLDLRVSEPFVAMGLYTMIDTPAQTAGEKLALLLSTVAKENRNCPEIHLYISPLVANIKFDGWEAEKNSLSGSWIGGSLRNCLSFFCAVTFSDLVEKDGYILIRSGPSTPSGTLPYGPSPSLWDPFRLADPLRANEVSPQESALKNQQ